MNNIIADKLENSSQFVLHPVTLTIIKNEPDKYMMLPQGDDELLSKQKFFLKTKEKVTINTDYDDIFLSDEYFYNAIFNTSTFDKIIETLKNIILSDYNINTVSYLLNRFIDTLTKENLSDKNFEELINLYNLFYEQFQKKTLEYSQLRSIVDELLLNNKINKK